MADFHQLTKRVLFRGETERGLVGSIPGAGTSAARIPRKHTKVKVTLNLDGDIVDALKVKAQELGLGYQVLMNQLLRESIEGSTPERLAKEVGSLLAADPSFLFQLSRSLKENHDQS